eukprot:1621694-Pleurochrysis_carterae.AAC.1
MASAAGVSRLHSVARYPRAAHAPASTQALRSGALGPLLLPQHPSRLSYKGFFSKGLCVRYTKLKLPHTGGAKPADFS